MSAGDRYTDQQQYQKLLKAELRQVQNELKARQQKLAVQRQRNEALRQEFARQFGHELLALIEGNPRAKVFVTHVVEKLVFQDELGNVISKIDGIPIGQIVEVKLVELPDRDD
jgi:CHAT domain-containing protein